MRRLVCLIAAVILSSGLLQAEISSQYLKDYLREGISNNLELQIQSKKLMASKAKKYQAFSNYLPKLDFSSRYTEINEGASIPLGEQELVLAEKKSTETKLELVQPIFNPAVYYNYRMQKSTTSADEYEYQAKVKAVEYSIIEAYYNCMKTAQLVEMKKTSLELAKENHYVTSKLYQVEKVPETDLLRAQVGLMTGEQELKEAENQFKLSRNYFNSVLNRDMSTDVQTDSLSSNYLVNLNLKDEIKVEETLEEAVKLALNYSPEIKQTESGVNAMKSVRGIASADFMPTLTAIGDYGYRKDDFKYNSGNDYWSITAMLSWNLFSGLGSTAKVIEMNANVKQMEKTSQNVKHMMELEVRNNYLDLKHNLNQFEVAQKTYQTALSNYNMVKKQYENELAAFINLTDAKNLLDSSRTNLIVNYFNVLLAKAKYNKSIGLQILK